MLFKKIKLVVDDTEIAKAMHSKVSNQLGALLAESTSPDLIIVLGGDGFMLKNLHKFMHLKIPFYGINCGKVGFLLNPANLENLISLIKTAEITKTYPLQMTAVDTANKIYQNLAFNEISILRATAHAAKLKISVDDQVRINELTSDGILLATPAGSTAYNSSVNGPILPLGSNLLALTPISPFSPKKWPGAILPANARVTIENLNCEYRKINVTADFLVNEDIKSVEIIQRSDLEVKLLFNPDHSLEERIIREQFKY